MSEMDKNIITISCIAIFVVLCVFWWTRTKSTKPITPATIESHVDRPLIEAYNHEFRLGTEKTLYRGSVGMVRAKFPSFRDGFMQRLGPPDGEMRGTPPLNDGAMYYYWHIDINNSPCTVQLALRGVSPHFQKQGVTATVELYVKEGYVEF